MIAGSPTGLIVCSGVKLGRAGDVRCTTALPPKADVHLRSCYVAFVPTTVIDVSSLDHLVGAGEQRGRNLDAERSRGRKIDHEFEFAGLNDRKIGGLGTLQDSASIDADLAKRFREARSVAHQPARFDIFACIEDGGNGVT